MTSQPRPEIAVRCVGLTKSYGSGDGSVAALRGVDLEVVKNELLMLVGPSGCGKTTLISIITAILDQDDGQCEVFGHDVHRMAEAERTRFRGDTIGFVFQAFNLLPALTALENVSVPLLLKGILREEAERSARDVLETVGLGDKVDTVPSKLSGGQQQRVAIGRALVHNPKLIICDEPTSNLDTQTGRAMMELLRDVAQVSDRTMIIVTHDGRIFDFADRIARMEDGRVVEVRKSWDQAGSP
ncbi:MAG: ABC transporter ATP-binding protein [Dokdonella sp.]